MTREQFIAVMSLLVGAVLALLGVCLMLWTKM